MYYDPAKHQWLTKMFSVAEGLSSDCESVDCYSGSPPLLSRDDSIIDFSMIPPSDYLQSLHLQRKSHKEK